MEKKMKIEGMKCMHCKANVEKALAAVPGVTGAEVSLEEKTAVIRMDAVKAKGFEPIKML